MTKTSSQVPFEIEVVVGEDDIDQLGHVNNVVYLRWVQDAATAHWYAIASDAEKRAFLWVVARHEIDYKRQAFLGDKIVARTWVGGMSGRAFERNTELVRQVDGKVLAKALTFWRPIDATTKKPTEVTEDVKTKFSMPGE